MTQTRFTTIILAGGKSSRMGENKAFMEIAGVRVIDRLVNTFSPISEEVIMIVNQPENYLSLHGVKKLVDIETFRGNGPLAGIYTGLLAAKTDYCFVVACDMPFASGVLSQWLIEECEWGDKDAAIPRHNGRIHPLFGAYHTRISQQICNNLTAGERKMETLINSIHARIVETSDSPAHFQANWDNVLWNMNTRSDFERAQQLANNKTQDI